VIRSVFFNPHNHHVWSEDNAAAVFRDSEMRIMPFFGLQEDNCMRKIPPIDHHDYQAVTPIFMYMIIK